MPNRREAETIKNLSFSKDMLTRPLRFDLCGTGSSTSPNGWGRSTWWHFWWIIQTTQVGLYTGYIPSGGIWQYLVWHKTGVVWTEYTQTKTGTFFSTFKHMPVALCTIRLQCFGAVFSALSCVLPNITPTEKLNCSNQRLTQSVQKLLSLWTACQNQVHSKTDSLRYLNTVKRHIYTSWFL